MEVEAAYVSQKENSGSQKCQPLKSQLTLFHFDPWTFSQDWNVLILCRVSFSVAGFLYPLVFELEMGSSCDKGIYVFFLNE